MNKITIEFLTYVLENKNRIGYVNYIFEKLDYDNVFLNYNENWKNDITKDEVEVLINYMKLLNFSLDDIDLIKN